LGVALAVIEDEVAVETGGSSARSTQTKREIFDTNIIGVQHMAESTPLASGSIRCEHITIDVIPLDKFNTSSFVDLVTIRTQITVYFIS